MIYHLRQPIFNEFAQRPRCGPSTMTSPHLAAIESANAMRDERALHFAVFPMLVLGLGGASNSAVAWDEGETA